MRKLKIYGIIILCFWTTVSCFGYSKNNSWFNSFGIRFGYLSNTSHQFCNAQSSHSESSQSTIDTLIVFTDLGTMSMYFPETNDSSQKSLDFSNSMNRYCLYAFYGDHDYEYEGKISIDTLASLYSAIAEFNVICKNEEFCEFIYKHIDYLIFNVTRKDDRIALTDELLSRNHSTGLYLIEKDWSVKLKNESLYSSFVQKSENDILKAELYIFQRKGIVTTNDIDFSTLIWDQNLKQLVLNLSDEEIEDFDYSSFIELVGSW